MSIQFQCPGCGKILAVGDENAGKQAKCPQCGLVSLVPESSTEVFQAEAVDRPNEQPAGESAPGSPFGAPAQPGTPFGASSQTVYRPINPHLVDAILVTLCCCLPFGIVGIVYAGMCKGQLSAGNYDLAEAYSKKANMWNMIGLAIGLTFNALYFLFVFLSEANMR